MLLIYDDSIDCGSGASFRFDSSILFVFGGCSFEKIYIFVNIS